MMDFAKGAQDARNDGEMSQDLTQHFTEAELDRYIEGKIEKLQTGKRQAPTRSSSSSSLVSECALSDVPFQEESSSSSTEEALIRKTQPTRKTRRTRKGNERASKRKRPKREDSSTEGQVFPPTRSPVRSPPIQFEPSSNWPPELAWLTQRYQSPTTRRTSALSVFEENEQFRNEVGQYVRKSLRSWNGSFTDDVLEPRLRDTLIAGTAEMKKAVGIPTQMEFQLTESEGWRRTRERALSGAVQSMLASMAITADVLKSLGNSPEDCERKEELGQSLVLMIDAATRADSSKYINATSEGLYSRSLGLLEPFVPQVQRQLQGEAQGAKLATPNQRGLPQVRNTSQQSSSSFFGRGGRSSTPGKESSSWRRLDTRPQQGQPLKQFTPRRDGESGQEWKRNQQ
ncbi:hypothetical protein BLNAU_980 [Blattamonas nauphoetae]|uniref:Uncharacterized protein n=1 Tax=Blattamonas nauphoetae TaxID=2049346 RepID=A0ABQ9YJH1_9EUKA|nr:hypothetical protein BLNAU_980 [Blattamonas nauphoetae]